MINTNVLECAKIFNVDKCLSLMSTCVYPDDVTYPLTEQQIHNGSPHHSNFAYAHAKRMLDVQSRAYRIQHGCNFITAVPNNMFGENDNYDKVNGHVIPSLIAKIYEAKESGAEKVTLWGSGSPLREFTYSVDIARILIFLLENYDEPHPINIGNTEEISISDLAQKICKTIGYCGTIEWDTTMPSGQHRKPSSNNKLISLGWSELSYTNFDVALKSSCDWFIKNYPNVRGIK